MRVQMTKYSAVYIVECKENSRGWLLWEIHSYMRMRINILTVRLA